VKTHLADFLLLAALFPLPVLLFLKVAALLGR
jgi:hypothetical protein